MDEFAATYTYLWFSLLLLVICLALLSFNRKGRNEVLISAALSGPLGFLSIFFVPDYWDPVRLVEFGTGLEDLIFSFAGGGIVWASVRICCGLASHRKIDRQRLLLTYLTTIALGLMLAKVLHHIGLPPMTITYLGFLVTLSVFLSLRPDLSRLSMVGAACYGSIYTFFCILCFRISPDFLNQWTLDSLSGYLVSGVPVEEIAWSFGFGAVWSLIIGYGLNVRTCRRPDESGRAASSSLADRIATKQFAFFSRAIGEEGTAGRKLGTSGKG